MEEYTLVEQTTYQLIDSSTFDKFGDFGNVDEIIKTVEQNQIDTKFNYCPECNIPMSPSSEGYECSKCHIVEQILGEVKDCSQESSGVIKMCYKSGNKSTFTSVPDNSKSQKKQIQDQLYKLNEVYQGHKIPKNILESAADGYNGIQRLIIDKYDSMGQLCGQKKFVKRGNIKNETLGAWLYYSCVNAGLSRKKKDVADFMQLPSNGISRGDDILRTLHNEGKITIPIHAEPSADFAYRYLDALGLIKMVDDTDEITKQSKDYCGFIEELVRVSENKKIATNSVHSSKIVGAIWVIVCHQKLPFTTVQIEEACDKIRKNTFTRFSKEIESNILKFIDVFIKYGIDHGIKNKIIKKSTGEVICGSSMIFGNNKNNITVCTRDADVPSPMIFSTTNVVNNSFMNASSIA
jgi:ribosomal protein S27AE